ncbi:MAG: glycosyltransferase [Saprospiraceae bacterium]|nr:glycosyltransferase [Saprospiraceae bacterium]
MNANTTKIICTVSNDLNTDRRMKRICSALTEFGADVTLIGVQRGYSSDLKTRTYAQKRLKLIFKQGFLFYAELNIRLFFYLLVEKFDVINSVDTDTVLASLLVSKLRRKKIVFDAHEFFTGVPELNGQSFKKLLWKITERVTLPFISVNYTVSDSLKYLYESQTRQKYEVIRNVPALTDFREISYTKTDEKIKICYVGALNVGRGLENAIRAMKLLSDEFKLILIGGGDLESELRRMVTEMKLNDRIEITGWTSPESIPELLKGGHIGLNLLDSDSESYRVSLANKVFDYLHMGIPCLTMNFEEYQKLNEEFNCFVLLDSIGPESIVSGILRIINDTSSYHRLSENSLKAAKKLNWETEKVKLKTIYFNN